MPKGVKGSKTATLTDTIAVKLTADQKREVTRATMQFGASDEIAENVGNQGFGLACIALGVRLMRSGEFGDLVEAYQNAQAEQAKAIKEATKAEAETAELTE